VSNSPPPLRSSQLKPSLFLRKQGIGGSAVPATVAPGPTTRTAAATPAARVATTQKPSASTAVAPVAPVAPVATAASRASLASVKKPIQPRTKRTLNTERLTKRCTTILTSRDMLRLLDALGPGEDRSDWIRSAILERLDVIDATTPVVHEKQEV